MQSNCLFFTRERERGQKRGEREREIRAGGRNGRHSKGWLTSAQLGADKIVAERGERELGVLVLFFLMGKYMLRNAWSLADYVVLHFPDCKCVLVLSMRGTGHVQHGAAVN